ncbi:unnamed protein product [Gongylonema pulchrum]|uniref:Conserved oligomeric Golgi complex subunit 4 n=1 Tax=Gongylonema pulchrum TaxID=637853 RepID=A0A183E7I3_9BILA|nr:unnamed protein product [Gongylonema pulchrum]
MAARIDEEETLVRSLEEMLHKTYSTEHTASSDVARSFNLAVTRLKNQMTLVSALDVAKGRVVECLQRVSDLMDLRTCADGVSVAMEQEDYELAARHIHKFLTLDTAVFQMGEQAEAKDTGQSMGRSYEILREAAAEMKSIVEKRFDQAVESNDVASIQRFFKLFPLLNEHANGIRRFGDYLCAEISKLAERNYKVILSVL